MVDKKIKKVFGESNVIMEWLVDGKMMGRTIRWQGFSSADPRGGGLGGDVAENAGAFRRPCTNSPYVSLSEAGCGRTPISEAKNPAVDLIPANYSWLESRRDGLQDGKVSVLQTPGGGL